MKAKSYGSTVVKVRTGLARHKQVVAEAWKADRAPAVKSNDLKKYGKSRGR